MPVTDRLMSCGRWELSLVADTPLAVRQAIEEFGLLIVTPVPLDRAEQTYANVTAMARYAGVIRQFDNGGATISGPSVAALLGDDASPIKGPYVAGSALHSQPTTFANQISSSVFASSSECNGISWSGTVTGTVSGSRTFALAFDSPSAPGWAPLPPRAQLDAICKLYGAEYQVTPQGDLRAGNPAALFYGSTNTLVCLLAAGIETHQVEGGGIVCLELIGADLARDFADRAEEVFLTYGSAGSLGYKRYSPPWRPSYAAYGYGMVTGTAFETSTSTTNATDASRLAQSLYEADHVEKWTWRRCEIDCYDPARYVTPGDVVGLYDPMNDVWFGSPMETNGRMIPAKRVRCYGLTWPIQSGMGVYALRSTSTTVTDLTPFAQWEAGTTTLEVGGIPRSLSSVISRPVRSS